MSDVAAAAGVARATLYRYFPTRERAAAGPGRRRPRRDRRPARRGRPGRRSRGRGNRPRRARGCRGRQQVRRCRRRVQGDSNSSARNEQLRAPIRALLRRGLDDGTFRGDLSVEELGFLFGSLLKAAARHGRRALSRRRESRGAGHLGVPSRHRVPQGLGPLICVGRRTFRGPRRQCDRSPTTCSSPLIQD